MRILNYILLGLILSSCVSSWKHQGSADMSGDRYIPEPENWAELLTIFRVADDSDLRHLRKRYRPKPGAVDNRNCNDAMRYALIVFDRAKTLQDLKSAKAEFGNLTTNDDCTGNLKNAAGWFLTLTERELVLMGQVEKQKQTVDELQEKLEALSSIERNLENRSR